MGRVRTGRRTNPDLRPNVSSDGSMLYVGCWTWLYHRLDQIKSNQLGTKRGPQVGPKLKQIRTLSVHLDSVSRASSISCPSDALISQHNLTSLMRYITNSCILIGQPYLSISTDHTDQRSMQYRALSISLDNNRAPVLVASHCREKLHT